MTPQTRAKEAINVLAQKCGNHHQGFLPCAIRYLKIFYSVFKKLKVYSKNTSLSIKTDLLTGLTSLINKLATC